MIASLALAMILPTKPAVQNQLIKVTFDQDLAAPAKGDEVAVLETSAGKIVVMFFPSVAPKHVENFKGLVKKGFYDGTRFHRCIPGFMIQGGDPISKDLDRIDYWGTGGPTNEDGSRLSVNAEFSELKHHRGVLSMARSQDPNSAGSQFFIMQSNYPSLDGQYSAFGKVVTGLEIVDKIIMSGSRENNGKVAKGSVITLNSAKLAKWPLE